QKVAVTRAAVQLAPRAAAGMPVGADVAKPQPAAIVTARMRTEMHRGVDGTRASVARRHRLGTCRRWRLRMGGGVFTGGTIGAVREAFEGFGFSRAFACEPRRHRVS